MKIKVTTTVKVSFTEMLSPECEAMPAFQVRKGAIIRLQKALQFAIEQYNGNVDTRDEEIKLEFEET